ncbi:uncharacterized protein [Elaeis guineensis]|uniref:uncharacterized protein n=1 Tax=Elaeis guineensis var. tenera TaxID=51953 RepID=UPI00094F5719
MEADRPSPDEHDGPSVQNRSYDCTFCKRGFSNAQALGGHMNIHRKDRAKLKQPSPSLNHFSNDKVPSYPPPLHSSTTQTPPGSDDGRFISQWPWTAPSDRHHHPGERTHDGGPQQLPLFVERPSRGYDRPSGSRGERQGETQQRSEVGEDTTGLDLELRLGPEPTDRSTTDHKDFV